MKKLDKKQVPQFAALCVVTAGLFGYFVVRLVTPSPAAAGTRPALAASAVPKAAGVPLTPADGKTHAANADAPHTVGVPAAAETPATDGSDVPPPSQGMRDPFAVGYVDPAVTAAAASAAAPASPKLPALGTQMASIKETGPAPISFPGAPALPANLSSFPLRSGTAVSALPAGPAAPPLPVAPPAWTVTGVLQGATEKIAVLRSGENRRIVRSGEFVDSAYRVVGVSRTAVVLRHGAALYRLTLGAAKDPAGKSASSPLSSPPPPAAQLPPAPAPAPNSDTLPAALSGLAGQLAPALLPATATDASHG